MGIDIEIDIRHLLLDCKEAGIEIKLDGDNLQVRGNRDRQDLYDDLKKKKADVVYAMSHIPDEVETYYLSRLRKGREWMDYCMVRLEKNLSNKKLADALVQNMIRWATVDEELRRLYPEYRGCPLEGSGGCDYSYAPVRCLHCAEKAKESNDGNKEEQGQP
tara:strand:- start:516 stop:998 length:483 start_codon:yes stop_codon:yes gene_type:complete